MPFKPLFKNRKTLTITLSKAEMAAVDDYAERAGISRAEVVRRALDMDTLLPTPEPTVMASSNVAIEAAKFKQLQQFAFRINVAMTDVARLAILNFIRTFQPESLSVSVDDRMRRAAGKRTEPSCCEHNVPYRYACEICDNANTNDR